MTSYYIPPVNKAPDNIILHCGSNDLSSIKTEMDISTELIVLAHSIMSRKLNLVISGLLRRGDSLESKRARTNAIIEVCATKM